VHLLCKTGIESYFLLTVFFWHSLRRRGVNQWIIESRPADLRAISDCSCPKSKLKTYLFQLAFNVQ